MPENELALLNDNLLVGAVLFGIGIIGFLSRRNMILMFLSAELMLQGVSLSLIAWGRFYNDFGGQMLVFFIITVAACEAAIALAMILMLFQRRGSLDIALWQDLREETVPAFVDHELPEEKPAQPQWPHLPPAGVEPEISPEEVAYRPCVLRVLAETFILFRKARCPRIQHGRDPNPSGADPRPAFGGDDCDRRPGQTGAAPVEPYSRRHGARLGIPRQRRLDGARSKRGPSNR